VTEILVNISLRAWHPKLLAGEITEVFGLPVEVSHSINDPRSAPNGRLLGGAYENTYVSMSMVRKKVVELDEELLLCIENIQSQSEFIANLVTTGGEVEFYVSVFLADSCGFNFGRSFINELAKIGIGVSVELYPEQPVAGTQVDAWSVQLGLREDFGQ